MEKGDVVDLVDLILLVNQINYVPSASQLQELREKHGTELETWWQENFGHAFDCLTQSEARYLARSPDADTIRDRIAQAKQAGNG